MKSLNYSVLTVTLLSLVIGCKDDSCDVMPNNEPSVITLQPGSVIGKDALVEYYPFNDTENRNYGSSVEFSGISWTDDGTQFIVRSLINFDLDTIPQNAVIDSVKLSLFAYGNVGHGTGHSTLDGSNECYLQRLIQEWEEDQVTWSNQPQTTPLNQVFLPESETEMQDYVGIDVTALVKDMINDPSESFGFMLRLKNETGYRRMFFATSDVEEAAKRPKLDIYYRIIK